MLAVVLALVPAVGTAQLNLCDRDARRISDAIARIEASVDPCGESAEVREVLAQVNACTRAVYSICTDSAAARNVFDRPVAYSGSTPPRTITWNPDLRTELEPACAASASEPLLRDPTASLLHELVHAAQDCRGLNPGEHELEAVRIENIYRRAAGLCARAGYGDTLLPSPMAGGCMESCSCSGLDPRAPALRAANDLIRRDAPAGAGREISGDRPSVR